VLQRLRAGRLRPARLRPAPARHQPHVHINARRVRRPSRLPGPSPATFQPLFRSTQQVLTRYSTAELELLVGFLRQLADATEQLIDAAARP
jgi:hypothetical protein